MAYYTEFTDEIDRQIDQRRREAAELRERLQAQQAHCGLLSFTNDTFARHRHELFVSQSISLRVPLSQGLLGAVLQVMLATVALEPTRDRWHGRDGEREPHG